MLKTLYKYQTGDTTVIFNNVAKAFFSKTQKPTITKMNSVAS